MAEKNSLFTNGATWLRSDFHLHTREDEKFSFEGDDDSYVKTYVDALENANIRIGVIANHNKFHAKEFSELYEEAKKRDILLLPGVELAVADGKGDVHLLIVFSPEWVAADFDYINPFLTRGFQAGGQEKSEGGEDVFPFNVIDTIDRLKELKKDFFVICAHVEDDKGLFVEVGGGRMESLGQSGVFREKVLGFQKVRTEDEPKKPCRKMVKEWLKWAYPAEVEGSNPRNCGEIGEENSYSYLKVGELSFDAVKFALHDFKNRVTNVMKEYRHSYIESISFEGGTLSGKTIRFSPELNTLIGIRGSGKSSILEALRYALDIPFDEDTNDRRYREDLVDFTIGSGGKVVVHAVNADGRHYEIRRILREPRSTLYSDGVPQDGVLIRETALCDPIYLGQKDLCGNGENFENAIVEKLIGVKLGDVKARISKQNKKIERLIDALQKIESTEERLEEQIAIKLDTEQKLEPYRNYGVEDRLRKRLNFDADAGAMKKGVELVSGFAVRVKELLSEYGEEIRDLAAYESDFNKDLFENYFAAYSMVVNRLDSMTEAAAQADAIRNGLSSHLSRLENARHDLSDEFACTERQLAADMKNDETPDISAEEFLSLHEKLLAAEQLIRSLAKRSEGRNAVEEALAAELDVLNELHREEFAMVKNELDRLNDDSSPIWIESSYKNDKTAFFGFMKEIFRGGKIREANLRKLVWEYEDCADIYKNIDTAKKFLGHGTGAFIDIWDASLKELLTYQTPNKVTIKHKGKELIRYSLGQRASALLLFILGQKKNDVVIIDQPEDDLDNQTIYEDVIRLIIEKKTETQFIFATHNPNIPVLGDAEQVHACSFADGSVDVKSGGIDDQEQQKNIVDIMEGGVEAFNSRTKIYTTWKPLRSKSK
ncbi:MAG: AAA family ATPase [Synergistaceae bacterium]|nr:AAA family ATPase [Synergistaceae bacterium]